MNRKVLGIAGGTVAGIIVADLIPGLAGHVLALLVWLALGLFLVLGPGRSAGTSNVRTLARVGAAVCGLLVVFAGSLAVRSAEQGPGFSAGYQYGKAWGQAECEYGPTSSNCGLPSSQSGATSWCQEAVGTSETIGSSGYPPAANSPDASSWVAGCTAALVAGAH